MPDGRMAYSVFTGLRERMRHCEAQADFGLSKKYLTRQFGATSAFSGGCVRTKKQLAFRQSRSGLLRLQMASSSFGTPRIAITRFRL